MADYKASYAGIESLMLPKKPPHGGLPQPSDPWGYCTICDLYRDHTLADVIEILREEHIFIVSKRQLVYRLNNWGIKKYNNTGEEPLEAGSDEQSEDEDGSFADDLKDDHGNVGNVTPPEAVADTVIPSNDHGSAGWPVRKANALLAMCFNGYSWGIFNNNNANVFGLNLWNMIALARAAETLEQCEFTLQVMESQLLLNRSSIEVLYLSLLILLVRDTKKDALKILGFDPPHGTEADTLKEDDLGEAISERLHELGDFLIKSDGSVDMTAHLLLDNLNSKHQNLLPSSENKNLVLSMLRDFNKWSGTGRPIEACKPIQVLTKCLVWCQQQLQHVCKNTGRITRLDLPVMAGLHQEVWKNHVELFGTLWATLEMEHSSAGGQWPEWARQSVETFNVSHAEVLACVCGMITYSPSRTFPAGGQAFGAPGSSWFANACTAAGQIAQLPALEMWTKFRRRFVQFNESTSEETDTGENRDFKTAVVKSFLAFIDETLGVMNDAVVGGGAGDMGSGGGLGGNGMGDENGPSQDMFSQVDDECMEFVLNETIQSQKGWADMMPPRAPQGAIFPLGTTFASSSLQPRA
ncbi:hypothetical protein CMUS01_06551 [Colletotrichum musicola]|uniref:Clr5 domain-containing protein n=1 Tax=Colletotrichum musicola TaxID=2175873 RepID=A0A8H6KLT0_9PEZI|nr:hypothetical protein CMUS01_06551 [Colletotrichum musicola]